MTAPDFAKEARDLIYGAVHNARTEVELCEEIDFAFRRVERQAHAAGLAEGLATAAEIARVEAGVRYAHVGQRIAEAILSARKEGMTS